VQARARRRQPSALDVQPADPPSLDELASRWQRALDAGEFALRAAADTLPASYLKERRRELIQERQDTAELLKAVARAAGRPLPWLSPVPVRKQMIGLPAPIRACLFDLDGVLTDSARAHASAWAQVLDEFLLRSTSSTGWHFIPFDPDADYRTYFDGRSRLEGIHAFLDSCGIRLPEGRVDDPPGADTAHGLARRKGEALARGLLQRGVTALPAVHRYLDAAGRAGLTRAVISASASTLEMLELAGLAGLADVYVDAGVIDAEDIRTAPAPDVLLAACRRLGVDPSEAVTFTHSAAGVVAGLAAGLMVVGVAEGSDAELLQDFGAQRIVPSLRTLLDASLVTGTQ
jgi:beta-phosphoglucomutase-like phosphatase (HAD superfamily)